MATVSGLMTVEEFRRLPEDGSFYYELHHGEAGIREKLGGLNVTQLRRVAAQYRFDARPPTGLKAPEFLDRHQT